jgi:sigma-B regulation protein RsbU (phosphoserine phosphatase)
VDFSRTVFYARKGFDSSLVQDPPAPGRGDWLALEPRQGRSLAVRDLGLDDVNRPSLFDFRTKYPQSFTIACVFEADTALVSTTGLSLFIPRIGQGWVVYLNGIPLHVEFAMGQNGRLSPERTLRNVIIPIDKRNLKLGANVLAFRIYGDPGDDSTGLAGGGSLRIDSYANLSRAGGEYLDIALIGIYALFALYHFILFALRPKHRTYIIYGAGAFLFSVYLFARSATAADIFIDTGFLRIVEYACLFVVIPIFAAFCETAMGRKVSIVSKLCLGAGVALAALLPFFRQEALKFAWELLTAAELLYLFGLVLGPRLVEVAKGGREGPRPSLGDLVISDAGLLTLGSAVVVSAIIADVITVNSGGDMRFTKYAFLVFVLAASAILALQFTGIYGELEGLRVVLERKVVERNAELADSVERQRRIGEEIEQKSRRLRDAMDMAARDLAIAERVQRGFLPAAPPVVPGWDLALAFRPAARVSGDFYDFYVQDGGLSGILLGDVSGHGIGAGLVSVLARSVFTRRWSERRGSAAGAAAGDAAGDAAGEALGDLLAGVHADLEGELGGVDEYLTCILLRMDGDRVEYANAAHPDLLYRKAGNAKAVPILPRGRDDFRGPPIGRAGFESGWSALRFTLGPGDALLLYTDCLEEARNSEGEQFGRARLLDSLSRAPVDSAAEALASIVSDVESFSQKPLFEDDLTAIFVLRKP